jgi:hypothetical protein
MTITQSDSVLCSRMHEQRTADAFSKTFAGQVAEARAELHNLGATALIVAIARLGKLIEYLRQSA